MRQPQTFIVRILPGEDEQTLHGQVSQPSSADDWRAPFASASELWQKLTDRLRLAAVTGPDRPDDPNGE